MPISHFPSEVLRRGIQGTGGCVVFVAWRRGTGIGGRWGWRWNGNTEGPFNFKRAFPFM